METDEYAIRMERLKKKCIVRKTMKLMRPRMLEILIGGLWHTTYQERYEKIVQCGSILVEPDIADSDRWSTRGGPEYYPYVRTLGGVSLFDFNEFEPSTYSERFKSSSWCEFVPFRESWESAVWIEINRTAVQERMIDGVELWEKCKREGAEHHRVMPHIEAAHLGDLPTSCFLRRLYVDADSY